LELNNISDHIKKNSWDIIEAWISSVLADEEIETSHHLSKFDLIDGIPLVLLAVSKNITGPIQEELSKEGLFGTKVSNQGKTRLKQGYNLREVFREYMWLREQIFAYLKGKDILSEKEYLLHSRLDRALDEQLLITINTFTEHYTKQLKERAFTDSLSGLYNRRAFFDLLDKELKRAKRYGHPLALMMLDLDNFKQYNDRLGHLAGDNYLKEFGHFLAEYSRTTDIASRFGGDEFAIVLPETTLDEAIEVAERIQSSFKKNPKLQTDVANIGISIGIGIDGKRKALEIYNLTDKLLYEAKRRGINKIVTESRPEKAA